MKRMVSMLLVGVMLFTSCAKSQKGDSIIKVGGMGPLTGDAALYGISTTNGAELAFSESKVLGLDIVFSKLDTKAEESEGINNYNKFVDNEKVIAIIGPALSSVSIAVGSASQSSGIPIITPSGTAVDITLTGENVFRTCFIDSYQGEVMANFASNSKNAKTAAILFNNSSDYSIGIKESFERIFKENGGEILISESYLDNDVDFKSQLTKIASTNPDVLLLPVYYSDVAQIAKQVQDIGLKTTLLGGDGWDGILDTIQDPALIEGSFYASHYVNDDSNQQVKEFNESYENKYGVKPNGFAALGYDSAKILMSAIEKAGSTDKEALVKAITETNIEALTGTMTYDENRNPIKSAFILEVVITENENGEKIGESILSERLDPK
jgi:branched-chain amino acid transport system substrate-binding protein